MNVRQGGFVSKIAEDGDTGMAQKHFAENSAPLERGAPGTGQPATDQHPPSSAQAAIPGWLDVPICVMDPFIRTKVCPIVQLRESEMLN